MTCTLVDGYQGATVSAQYVPKTVQIAAGGSTSIGFLPSDLAAATYIANPNLTCSLPPGTGVTYAGLRYLEDVGN